MQVAVSHDAALSITIESASTTHFEEGEQGRITWACSGAALLPKTCTEVCRHYASITNAVLLLLDSSAIQGLLGACDLTCRHTRRACIPARSY